MNKKIIIGLVGQIACGKGTVAKYLEKQHGAGKYRFSTILRDIMERLYLKESRKNISLLSKIIRENFGEDALTKTIINEVKNDDNNLIVIDGIRRLEDVKLLRKIKGFILVRVVADPKKRYKRLVSRAENAGDAEKTYEEFLRDQEREADAQIPEVMSQADEEINNDGTYEELLRQTEKLYQKLLKNNS